ncbi:MAG TPA: hypothetical protein VGN72_17790 [Tepidisphaeraceae bacterium]|jgi:hypothetical protein|nr:hypothetical protein [Tepidisphaeraceae bacterium]
MRPEELEAGSSLRRAREAKGTNLFRQLDAPRIVATGETLAKRIHERFPQSNLAAVATDLVAVSRDASQLAGQLAQPMVGWRALSITLTVALLVLVIVVALNLRVSLHVGDAIQLVQGIEALINDIVFAGIAIWFAFSIETRRKRGKALRFISQLRSLAHVIDMHQLDKDPDRYDPNYKSTASSPKPDMTPAQLMRYLDYCSEMLAILGKLAALCAQRSSDPPTLAAVNELEDLSSGLSRKVWQKIMILDRMLAQRPA